MSNQLKVELSDDTSSFTLMCLEFEETFFMWISDAHFS